MQKEEGAMYNWRSGNTPKALVMHEKWNAQGATHNFRTLGMKNFMTSTSSIFLFISHSRSLSLCVCAFFLARCAYICLCFYKMMHVSSLVNNFLCCLAWENLFRSFSFVEFCLFVCFFVGICSLGLCVECRSFTLIF